MCCQFPSVFTTMLHYITFPLQNFLKEKTTHWPCSCFCPWFNNTDKHTPTMILTVTEASPGGMVPSVSMASTVNVYTGSEPVSASKSSTLRTDSSPVIGSMWNSRTISGSKPSVLIRYVRLEPRSASIAYTGEKEPDVGKKYLGLVDVLTSWTLHIC